MRTTNTFSILFWVDQKKAIFNYALIYARVTVDELTLVQKEKYPLKFGMLKRKKLLVNPLKLDKLTCI